MKLTRHSFGKIALVLGFGLCAVSCGTDESVTDSSLSLRAAPGGGSSGGSNGGKCRVTSGSNKGKTGTYNDGRCEGSWGGTECAGPGGTNRCQDVKKVATTKPVVVGDGGFTTRP
ncbi:MAG: hypothetical protein HRU19_20945 [Pseudobacteriovorax sp.]|nr:hypothetical protein [Pseudobacteriovorax sp.]